MKTLTLPKKTLGNSLLAVGKPAKQRLVQNIDYVLTTPSGIDLIKSEKSIKTLRKSLYIITNIVARGGNVLVYAQNQRTNVEKGGAFSQISTWPKGLISNFKYVSPKQPGVCKRLPNFVVIVSDNDSERLAIDVEARTVKLPTLFTNNTDQETLGLYPCVLNTESASAKSIILNLIKKAVTVGLLKETTFLNMQHFPRLGSNQRPRT